MKKLLTIRMAAEVLHRHDNTIYHWIAEGLLPASKVRHGVYMIERDECRLLKNGRARLADAPRPAYRDRAAPPDRAAAVGLPPVATRTERRGSVRRLAATESDAPPRRTGLAPMAPGTRPSPDPPTNRRRAHG